jgi:glycosyltransferase involved in cell wall biosynthesis
MRITHYIDSTDVRHGGVPRVVLDILSALPSLGHEATLLTPDPTDAPREWLGHSDPKLPRIVKLERNNLPTLALPPAALRQVKDELEKTDVLHLNCVWSLANIQLASLARKMGVPYVLSSHGMLDRWCMEQQSLKKQAYLRHHSLHRHG